MNICKKCGKIYFDAVDTCDVCNSKDFFISNEISLMDYECQNCKSMYRNKIEICPNCGSKNINEIGSDRKIISNLNLDNSKTRVDTSRFDKISKIMEVINELCTSFRIFFGLIFIIMGLVLLRFNENVLVSVVTIIAFFFCMFTGFLSINGSNNKLLFCLRLVCYIAIVIFSYFDKDPSVFYASLGMLLLYIIITIVQRLVVPKINSINDAELKKIKEQRKSLVKNGVIFSNLDYELVPTLNNKYYIRVAITNPSGIVIAFQSKQRYSKIDFETVDVLIDVHDFSNYQIYQHADLSETN